ncbi:rCG48787 [Rattus norvegicus]|uniref:RCG48787 n=1 Tax=Rattus norvegicus TaxID=10116 RepID=A6IFG0_RAT|nr:rCG48787 [Rattus norvegicus]
MHGLCISSPSSSLNDGLQGFLLHVALVVAFYHSNRSITVTTVKKDSRNHGGCWLLPSFQTGLYSASFLVQSGAST